jgi:hypothetical protein
MLHVSQNRGAAVKVTTSVNFDQIDPASSIKIQVFLPGIGGDFAADPSNHYILRFVFVYLRQEVTVCVLRISELTLLQADPNRFNKLSDFIWKTHYV